MNGFICDSKIDRNIATSSILMELKFLHGVADYKGLPRSRWIIKSVLLKDKDGQFEACGVCNSMSPNLVSGSNGLLHEDKVVV